MAAPRPQSTPSTDVPHPQPRPETTHTPRQGAMPGHGNPTNSTTRPPSTAPPPPPVIPSLDELLAMTDDEVSKMSISALKTVLFQNHVNAGLILEKSDLVERVHALLGDERQERAREAAIHAREEEEIISRQHAMMEEQRCREERPREGRENEYRGSNAHAPEDSAQQPKPKVPPPPMMGTAADLERNGLCVVCQDEEANIAIVDCGCVFTSSKIPAHNERRFVAIWQCVATAQISSCPLLESAHFVGHVSLRRHDSSAYSNHSVVSSCFALNCIHFHSHSRLTATLLGNMHLYFTYQRRKYKQASPLALRFVQEPLMSMVV
jgi:hypothetical protein